MYGRHCVTQQFEPLHVEVGSQLPSVPPLLKKIPFVGSFAIGAKPCAAVPWKIMTAAVPPPDFARPDVPSVTVNVVVDGTDATTNVPL